MSLSVGIVGLANAGKSTLFNALASRRLSETAPRPFTTIDPHEAVVAVHDEDFHRLCDLIKPEKCVPATVAFIDIAGLVKNAHKGEGLGNQFLAKIREVDAIVHVIRVFENENIPHATSQINPKEDLEIVKLELGLAGIKKPVLYIINVSEKQLQDKQFISSLNINNTRIIICAKLEEELSDLLPKERKEYL